MLDDTYYGLTASDWRTAAVILAIFAAFAVLSLLREKPPRRRGGKRAVP